MRRKHTILYTIVIMGWLLGVHKGYIALWKDGSTEPERVFPYRASLLPDSDRRQLEKGIPFEDIAELTKRLEDYLS